jgi:hypothetical protein
MNLKKLIMDSIEFHLTQYIKTINTDKIFISEPDTRFVDEIPCILAYILQGTNENTKNRPFLSKKSLEIAIEVLHGFSTYGKESEEFLYTVSEEIEDVFIEHNKLGLTKMIDTIELKSEEPFKAQFENDVVVNGWRMRYEIKYIKTFEDKNITFDEFKRYKLEIKNLTNNLENVRE